MRRRSSKESCWKGVWCSGVSMITSCMPKAGTGPGRPSSAAQAPPRSGPWGTGWAPPGPARGPRPAVRRPRRRNPPAAPGRPRRPGRSRAVSSLRARAEGAGAACRLWGAGPGPGRMAPGAPIMGALAPLGRDQHPSSRPWILPEFGHGRPSSLPVFPDALQSA